MRRRQDLLHLLDQLTTTIDELTTKRRHVVARPWLAADFACFALTASFRKLSNTHRYQISGKGRLILNAVLSAQRITTQQLTRLAA
jgi:hypothetical protein